MRYLKKFENIQNYWKKVNDFDYDKLVDVSFDAYDKIGMILDKFVQEGICELELTHFNYVDEDDTHTLLGL